MNKKLKLTEQQHEAIVNEILKETVEKLTKMESEGRLDEGFWSAIKYAISKLGRYKAGGKIFGKGKVDQEYAAKIASIIEKEGNEMIRDLDDKIKETNPEFPNNEDPQKFLSTVLAIAAVYDSVVEATKKNPKEKGYMPIDAANGIINDLREYVNKFLDVDLTAIYTGANENEDSNSDLINEEYSLSDKQMDTIDEEFGLNEQGPLDASDVRQQLQAKRTGGEDFKSTRMDTLKSNKLPLVLAGVGASLGALGWMAQTDWFKTWLESLLGADKTITNTKEIIDNVSGGQPDSEGFVNWASKIMGKDLRTGADIQAFIDKYGAENVSHMFDGNGAGDSMGQVQKLQELINSNPNASVGDLFNKADQTFGDMKGGGNLFGISKAASFFATTVTKQVTKTLVKGAGTALAGTLAGLGPIVAGLGIGLLTTGALVKLFRMKGQKSSRAATLGALYQSIRNIEGGIGLIEPKDEKTTGGSQDNLYNSLKNLFQFIVNNKNTMGSGKYDTSNQTNAGDRFYQGGQIMKGGKRAARKGGETQTGRERFFTNQGNVRENEEALNEGKYITDKNVLQYLSKYMPFEKVKNFENLITRVEYLRNVLKKMGAETEDKVLNGFLKQLQTNPIMMTDFNTIFAVNPSNPQEVNSLLGMMKEILNNVYSKDYKFGTNMVDKMSTLGGGNINKLEEAPAYNSAEPNKSFQKDAQSKTTLKNNLVKFLQTTMSMFQYLHKQKTQKPQQKQAAPQQAAPQQPVNESLNKELDRIKKIMFS
jgi:uncharacterized protein YaiE (UPF0345 family)